MILKIKTIRGHRNRVTLNLLSYFIVRCIQCLRCLFATPSKTCLYQTSEKRLIVTKNCKRKWPHFVIFWNHKFWFIFDTRPQRKCIPIHWFFFDGDAEKKSKNALSFIFLTCITKSFNLLRFLQLNSKHILVKLKISTVALLIENFLSLKLLNLFKCRRKLWELGILMPDVWF